MKEYFKHVYQPVDGLSCVLRIVDVVCDDEVYPAIELAYAQEGKKKKSFAMLKDVLTGKDLIPELAECFKSLLENQKSTKTAECRECGGDFEKKSPAQKYCTDCHGEKKEKAVSMGDTETKGDN